MAGGKAMAMDAVLKQLEAKVEELVVAYGEARGREAELAAKVAALEGRLASGSDLQERLAALEAQRDELGARLQKILGLIDSTLVDAD